jgi:hypothetical protein
MHSNNEKQRTNEILATAAAIAAATASAHAEAIRHENTTNFDWLFNTLDLTQSAEDQSFGITGSSIYMDYFGDFYPTFSYSHIYTSGDGAEIFNSGFSNRYAAPLDAGTLIGPSLTGGEFSQASTFEFAFTSCDYYYPYNCTDGTRGILPAGVDTYLGVRLTINGNFHYGWVGVNRSGTFLDVFAWGYETEAGVGIRAGGVPSPGPLAVLAIGAAGALSRKRRPA